MPNLRIFLPKVIKASIIATSKKYDYIIAGAGLSGLSLAYKIRQISALKDKSILLVDKDKKDKNDRTWSFWSHKPHVFDSILYKEWSQILFANHQFEKTYDIAPYSYKMIRGIDFYEHTLGLLNEAPLTDFVFGDITEISETADETTLTCNGISYTAPTLFKSFTDKIDFSKSNFVWQHFKGWIIKTEEPTFDPNLATFMDFRVEQDGETRFFYVLPKDAHTALVEIAIFSNTIPESSFYDPYLKDYIREYIGCKKYEIIEEELNAIPMTDFNFNPNPSSRIINIGTNGGSVKGSSGYAYKYIQKETDRIVTHITDNKLKQYKPLKNRYKFYDSIFLNAILTNKTSGEKVFSHLFKKLSPQLIFKFLDEEATFFDDLKVFTAPPTLPFTKALIEEVFKSK